MKVGVYGLGRFGTLWAGLLAQQFEVLAYNRSARLTVPEGVTLASLADVAACKAVFLCVAISAVRAVALEIRDLLSPGATVLDTCSVKTVPVTELREVLPPTISIVGTHPMFGPDSARNGFRGLPIIVTPGRIDDAGREFWVEAFRRFGLTVHQMTEAEHDREAAYTQGVTHFIGRVLKELALAPSPIATLGYRKLLEVMEQTCNDPWQLFMDLQNLNPYTGEMRRDLQRAIRRIMEHFPEPGSA